MLVAAVGLLREARIVEGAAVKAAVSGGRIDLLAERLPPLLADGASGLISIGIGGALDPTLRVGEVVIGEAVIARDGRWGVDAGWAGRLASVLPNARRGAIRGEDRMVVTAADKAALREGGAIAVDMESHVAARLAVEFSLPFAALRVVSDEAGRDLPPAVLAGMKPDGGMNLWGVLGALARRPGQLPALMRAGRDADAAFQALAQARAALGPDLAYSAA